MAASLAKNGNSKAKSSNVTKVNLFERKRRMPQENKKSAIKSTYNPSKKANKFNLNDNNQTEIKRHMKDSQINKDSKIKHKNFKDLNPIFADKNVLNMIKTNKSKPCLKIQKSSDYDQILSKISLSAQMPASINPQKDKLMEEVLDAENIDDFINSLKLLSDASNLDKTEIQSICEQSFEFEYSFEDAKQMSDALYLILAKKNFLTSVSDFIDMELLLGSGEDVCFMFLLILEKALDSFTGAKDEVQNILNQIIEFILLNSLTNNCENLFFKLKTVEIYSDLADKVKLKKKVPTEFISKFFKSLSELYADSTQGCLANPKMTVILDNRDENIQNIGQNSIHELMHCVADLIIKIARQFNQKTVVFKLVKQIESLTMKNCFLSENVPKEYEKIIHQDSLSTPTILKKVDQNGSIKPKIIKKKNKKDSLRQIRRNSKIKASQNIQKIKAADEKAKEELEKAMKYVR